MSRISSFRGQLASGEQERINLHTITGMTGYQIVKFQVMSALPFQSADEHIVKIYKTDQTNNVDGTIDFENNRLLGAAIINSDSAGYRYASNPVIIFDNEKFNQDIYVTAFNGDGTASVNYYIELKGVRLDLSEQTVATLKDIRNVGVQ